MPRYTGPAHADARGIVIGMHELGKLRKRFARFEDVLTQTTELAEAVGQQQEDSARRRIRETKRSPEGKKWKKWSENYAKTRGPQHSLLVSSGDLADSLTHTVLNPGEVAVGSNLEYAAVHLYGSKKIPARPYLDVTQGFGDPRDRAEIRELLRDIWKREIGR